MAHKQYEPGILINIYTQLNSYVSKYHMNGPFVKSC